jgi:glycerophosphoryl diester phosphodiesterase
MPWLVAHRGAMAEAPENTKSSFDKALSYPIDGIELDVQITRDGIPVIFHDDKINKKANGTGRISDYTYSELCRFDWGSWFSESYRGEKVLSLKEVLTHYSFKTHLFIEIKSAPHRDKVSLYSQLPILITELIRQKVPDGQRNNIYILSFNQALLASAYKNDPDLKYVLNLEDSSIVTDHWIIDVNRLGGVCLPYRKLTPEFITWCHQFNKKVMTYSCNTRKRILKAICMKIDVVMTDDPGAVIDSFMEIKKEC